MKKILAAVFFTCIFLLAGAAVFAQADTKMIALPRGGGPSQLFGQNQWYSVVFRGNGEAVVNLRTVFTNSQSSPADTVTFRVPRVTPTDLMAFQVIAQGPCIRYQTVKNTPAQNPDGVIYPPQNPVCIQYGEPDLNTYYGTAKYQRANTEYAGDTITVTLPQSVAPEKSGSILLYYRAFGYAKKDLVGGYHFTFETLKTPDSVQQLQVGISTDSDLLLRGAKGNVNYRFEDVSSAVSGMTAMAAPAANSKMDAYYHQVGQGDIVKTASNLEALESYTVKGSYADNILRLYANEIAAGVLIVALLIAGAVWGIKALMRVGSRAPVRPAQPGPSVDTQGIILMGVLSFVSSLIMLAYSGIVYVFFMNLNSWSGNYDMIPLFLILILIISLAVFGFFLFAPGVFIGIRRGWALGLGTAGLTIFWLVIGFILMIVLLSGRERIMNYQTGTIMPAPGVRIQSAPGSAETTTEGLQQ